MGTDETVGEKNAARKKLKLNKEAVKDLGVKKDAGDAVKGAAAKTQLSSGCMDDSWDC